MQGRTGLRQASPARRRARTCKPWGLRVVVVAQRCIDAQDGSQNRASRPGRCGRGLPGPPCV